VGPSQGAAREIFHYRMPVRNQLGRDQETARRCCRRHERSVLGLRHRGK
jgi:hypothetical protein